MSSGEAILLALRQPNSRSFGKNTAGLSTCNYSHELKDGAVLWLTESYFADRYDNMYGNKIEPDEIIESSDGDLILETALEWLKES